MLREMVAAIVCLASVQAVAADDGSKGVMIDPEKFTEMVAQKQYKEAHDTAVAEAKRLPEELEYVRGNKLVPYNKRYIYTRRALEYYEVFLATGEDRLAEQLEKEVFKTLPDKAGIEKMLDVCNRVDNTKAKSA